MDFPFLLEFLSLISAFKESDELAGGKLYFNGHLVSGVSQVVHANVHILTF